MSKPFAKQGDVEFLSSGSIVASGTEDLIFYPFAEDLSYEVIIRIKIDDASSGSLNMYIQDAVVLEITRPWAASVPSAAKNTLFAQDETYSYYINMVLLPIGKRDSFSVLINYTVGRKSR